MAKFLIENVGGFDYLPGGKKIPRKEYRASRESAEKRARAQLTAQGVTDIKVTPLLGMTIFSGGPAMKFVVEEAP